MTPRPHPAYALALTTALIGAAPLTVAADEPAEPTEHCLTYALTVEEVQAGEVSVIECYPIDEPLPAARASIDLADVFLDLNGLGTSTTIRSTSCTGAAINLTGTGFDNNISSTDLLACGSAKHYTNNNFTGSNQLVSGAGIHNMNATLNNQTSSIEYAP